MENKEILNSTNNQVELPLSIISNLTNISTNNIVNSIFSTYIIEDSNLKNNISLLNSSTTLYITNSTINIIKDVNSFKGNNDTILNNSFLYNNTLSSIITSNNTKNNLNQSKPFLSESINIPIINKNMNTNLALCLGILIPIILILLVIFICYCIKKRMKLKMISSSNDNIDVNKIQINNSGIKYNRIQNTSGINNVAVNPSISEIKVQNMKQEINNIISNNSEGSSSSGRRRREKKKSSNKNMMGFQVQGGQEGIENEIKEQIKQYVIDEHNNNN